MTYAFYVLKSHSTGKLYKGHTSDLTTRVHQHNSGRTRSTKSGAPWELIYVEEFQTRDEALQREKQSKTGSGGRALHKLLKSKGLLE